MYSIKLTMESYYSLNIIVSPDLYGGNNIWSVYSQ